MTAVDRWIVTDVAWLTLAQPPADDDDADAAAETAACPEAAVVALTVPHPATAAHSTPATTIP
jgi:hypothetical protein